MKIKRINEDKSTEIYNTLQEAARDVQTSFDLWKVEMLIQNAINTKTRAFKAKWYKEEK